MKKIWKKGLICAAGLILIGCSAFIARSVSREESLAQIRAAFSTRGQADVARLDQDALQRTCSEFAERGEALPTALAAQLEAQQLAGVKAPTDHRYLGDWKAGETVAQSGRGMQWSDAPGSTAGGNCYACHQLDKKELSYGNIGPTLYNYGKVRGTSDVIVQYTWGRIYNSHAYNACSNMPRFGAQGILTQKQMQDVMALLLDQGSPVNQ